MVGKPAIEAFGVCTLDIAQGGGLIFKRTILPTDIEQGFPTVFVVDIDMFKHAMSQKCLANRETRSADSQYFPGGESAVGVPAGLESIEGRQPRSVQILKTGGKQAIGHCMFRLLCQHLFTTAFGSLELFGLELLVCLLPKIDGHLDGSLA